MKRIWIARHAKTEVKHNINDIDRQLTERGVADCAKAATYLKQQGILPQLIICSSSARTVATTQNILANIQPNIPVEVKDSLYRASQEDILDELKSLDNKYNDIMIVAHNPGVHDFCREFALKGHKDSILVLQLGMSPACIAHFTFNDIKKWQEISPAAASLEWFFVP